ncbi:MAG: hypothetical protein AB8B69_15210 [Chitinophagales bacterium]
MLVIISDLHFTDGSSGQTIGAGAFKIFKDRINEIAYRASKQKGDTYQPIERIDILLLGDILDIIRSDVWLKNPNGVRPWSDLQDNATIDVIEEITQKTLDFNQEALSLFKELQKEPQVGLRGFEEKGQKIRLPVPMVKNTPAMRSPAASMPASFLEAQQSGEMLWKDVKVKIHYMVGNHDWFFHLKGERYNQIRQSIIDAMGLSNRADQPFPHEPEESPELLKILQEHKVFARHGDIYDNFNYEGNRDKASLGDAVVIELVNRFPKLVHEQLADEMPQEFIEGLKELDNVRPIFYIPIWISGLLERTVPNEDTCKKVQKLWNAMVDDFMKLEFIKERDTWSPIDRVDKLQIALKISRLPFDFLNSLVLKFQQYLPEDPSSTSFSKHALKEGKVDCGDGLYNYVVYGHTHHFEMVPLKVCDTPEGAVTKLYINSGTFRSVHDLVALDDREKQFFSHKVMTYLIFYKEQERKGRGFEIWNGSLGM